MQQRFLRSVPVPVPSNCGLNISLNESPQRYGRSRGIDAIARVGWIQTDLQRVVFQFLLDPVSLQLKASASFALAQKSERHYEHEYGNCRSFPPIEEIN